MNDELRGKRNEFIYHSFRDVADCDYITARTLHRLKLFNQFSWSALQAIEKYLKTILLIYDRNTKQIGHKLTEGLIQVENITDINWDFDVKIRKFIEYSTIFGGDRYFTFPWGTEGNELFILDYTVWKIRRYCQDLQWMKILQAQQGISIYDDYIKQIQSQKCFEKSNKFRLLHKGYLERVLDTKRFQKQREQLVYKNFYYGSYKKRKIIFARTIRMATPSHFYFPEIYSWVLEHVKLSEKAKEFFETRTIDD